MTRDEILKMKPGICLDTLICEKVMEWDPDERCWPSCFHPSMDISSAWRVMEKMREQGRWPGVTVDPNGWEAWQFDTEGRYDPPVCKVVASTAPEAICKTALLAVERQE